jgi:hypothetical protein
MAEVFSDDLNLKIGDLLSRPLSPATRPPCARPFILKHPIQAHTYMFARAPVSACATATRAHPLFAHTRCSLRAANECAPVPRAHPVPTLRPPSLYPRFACARSCT